MSMNFSVQQHTGDFNKFCENEETFFINIEVCKRLFNLFLKSFGRYWPNPKLKKILHSNDLCKSFVKLFIIYWSIKVFEFKNISDIFFRIRCNPRARKLGKILILIFIYIFIINLVLYAVFIVHVVLVFYLIFRCTL